MSVLGGIAKATAGAMVLRATTPTTRVFPKSKWMMVVAFALVGLAVVIPASQAPNTEHYSYSVETKDSQWATEATATAPPAVSESGAAPQMSEQEALDAYTKLPLSFIPNQGQTTNEEAVRYYAQGAGYGFFFTKGGAMLSFANGEGRGHALGLDFLGANPEATLTAQKRLSGEVNYLVGNDQAKWHQGLPTHGELLYGGLWPGIDMAVRGEGGKLKYEFHVQPGSSVEDIRLDYRGAEGLSVGAGGELLVRTSLGTLKDAAPVSYQLIGGERVGVESRYKLLKGEGGGGYGFAVGAYDPRYPLIIDPALAYSTFLGGTRIDRGDGIAVDGSGRAYVTGFINSADFPTTTGAFDTTHNGTFDAFVTKLNASGSALAYSTYLGGTSASRLRDRGHDIAEDESGRAYVTGETVSSDFPTTPDAFDTTYNGRDAFATKLNAAGSALAYSTFLGGTGAENVNEGGGIAVDGGGNAYVTGDTFSSDFPTTAGAFDTTFNGAGGGFSGRDVFVTKLNASGSQLDYSTFLGGDLFDSGEGIAVDGSGRAYVTGGTSSSDFPTTAGAFDTTFDGGFGAFVTKLNVSGSALDYSTFLGGTGVGGSDIAVRDGRAYVTGTAQSADYPTTAGAFDTSFNGNTDAFVTKLNAAGSALAYSTFLGGTGDDDSEGIAVDGTGRAYVTGGTSSVDYPTTTDAFDTTFSGGQDVFVTRFNASGSALAYSTFLGRRDFELGLSIAVEESARAYVTGGTSSVHYPTSSGAFDTTFNGGQDAFVTKLPTG
jgi:hypothetical protein